MAVAYESRRHRVADLFMGLLFTVVVHWQCDKCGRTTDHFTKSQRRQWDERVPVECRRLMLGRRTCCGHLVRAVAS